MNNEQEFNWELYSHYKGNKLVKNPYLKTRMGENVYSFESYANDLYDLMAKSVTGSTKDLVEGNLYSGVIFSISDKGCVATTDSGQSIYIDTKKEDRDCDKLKMPRISFTIGQELNLIASKNPQGYFTGSVVEGYFQSIKID